MEKQLCSSGLYSHKNPKKPLEVHLINVHDEVKTQLEAIKFGPNGGKSLFGKDDFLEMATTAALCHDLGKSTSYFQEYLLTYDATQKAKLKKQPETKHSKFSALAAFFYAYTTKCMTFEKAYVIYTSILHHHGNLRLPSDDVDLINGLDILRRQWESIDKEKFDILLKAIDITFPEEFFFRLLSNNTRLILDMERNLLALEKRKEPEITIAVQLIFSLLIDADKSDAAGLKTPGRTELPYDLVDRFKALKEKDWKSVNTQRNINGLREQLYSGLDGKIDALPLGRHIYSINAPTGSGKTLAGFNFALKLREKLKKEKSIQARVIYCLPFLSIIEQNFKVFENVFEAAGALPPSGILLKHHHLSDYEYDNDNFRKGDHMQDSGDVEELEYDIWQKKALVENWNSEIIVTTFHQFFHSFFGWRNSQVRKYHRIANSIIVLDEVQAFPHKYWSLFNKFAQEYAELMNTYIVLMTATIPLIFSPDECLELVSNKETLFDSLSRVNIYPQLQRDSLDSLDTEIEENSGKSVLYIMNTISCAEQLYQNIKTHYPSIPVFFLSTHLTPKQRLERIEKVREMNARKVLISTQLIEAGVDVDFDVVVRDIAPLDSIIQSAGRCNRNSKKDEGRVIIVNLKNEKGKYYHSFIYDNVLMDQTKKVLKNAGDKIEEKDLLTKTRDYYQNLNEVISTTVGNDLYQSICRQNFDGDKNSLSSFALIEQDQRKADIFIEIDDEAKQVWNKFRGITTSHLDRLAQKTELLKIRKDFYKFVISIPLTTLMKNLPPRLNENSWIYYVPKSQLPQFYDIETGYKTTSGPAIW